MKLLFKMYFDLCSRGLTLFVLVLCFTTISFAQKTWDGGGDGVNWSSANNWNPNGVPANTDDVTIGNKNAVTVDMAAVCASLSIGSGGAPNPASVTISGANTLSITTAGGGSGDLTINAGSKASTYLLAVGSGAVVVEGTFSGGYSASFGSQITVGTGSFSVTNAAAIPFPKACDITVSGAGGSVSFAGAITFDAPAGAATNDSHIYLNSNGTITFSGLVTNADQDNSIENTGIAGTINFDGGFTLSQGGSASLVTMAGSTVNFGGSLTVSTDALVFNATSTANFNGGTPTITPTAAITFGNLTITGVTVTLAGNIIVAGNWSNMGGALTAAGFTTTFTGTAKTIGGSALTAFAPVVIDATAVYTMNNSNSCTTLTFNASGSASSLTLGATNPTLTISGATTINQPTGAASTGLYVGGGTCTIGGTLAFVGGNATAGRIGEVQVTAGSLTCNGAVNFADNTVDANQVIKVSGGGNVTFNSNVYTTAQTDLRDGLLTVTGNGSMTFTQFMDMQGGTLNIGALGTMNFDKTGATAFSYTNTSVPTLTTASGATLNFKGDVTIASVAAPPLVFADGSFVVFTGNSTLTPTAALTLGNLTINSGITLTCAGDISLTNDWTNLGGTHTPGTNTTSFIGTLAQTIKKASATETFYGLTLNNPTELILESTTDVTISNTLTMTSGNINLNGKILQLGNGSGATLVRSGGYMYSNTGTFSRYLPSGTSISSTVAPLYGLFPMGTADGDYRPVEINSTVNATSPGYVSLTHYDPPPPSYIIDVSYTDNEGDDIQRISTIENQMSTSGGFAGGTYDIYCQFTGLSTQGVLTDLKLETYTGAAMGSVGTTVATAGTVSSPLVKRSGLTAAELANDFVIGTKDKSVTGTPIRQYYYSRKNGNWSDVTAGDGTWSFTAGGAGPSCDCIPDAEAYVVISDGQTVTMDMPDAVEYVDINDGSTIDGTNALTISKDLRTLGAGKFTPTAGSWTISRDVLLAGTGSSSWAAASTVGRDLNIGTGVTLTMSGGAALTVSEDFVIDGTLALGSSTMTLDGPAGSTISNSGAGSITGVAATVNITTADKTISAATSLTIAPTFAITGAIEVTNSGTITLTGSLTGSVGGSTWTNAANSALYAGSAVLTTGTLNAVAAPNLVDYNGAGGQTIKTPNASTYYNLACSNFGTKSMAASLVVSNLVTVQDAAILDEVVNANDLSGAGGLTMTGTSGLIVRNTLNNLTLPELTGVYTLTSGTVTITSNHGGGANYVQLRGATYYNLVLDGVNNHKLSAVSTITNDLVVTGSVYFNDNPVLTVGGLTTYSSTNSSTLNANFNTGSFLLSAGTFNDGGNDIAITAGDWTYNGGTFTTSGITSFTSSTAMQTIGGSLSTTFYNLTFNNTFGTKPQITLGLNTNVNNTLAMTNGVADLAGYTLTLGTSGNPSTLNRGASATTNWVYGGTFKREWLNATAITSASGNYYGLYPVGESNAATYSPLEINSTVNPTSDGSFSVRLHFYYNPPWPNPVNLSPFCDDAGTDIERIHTYSFVTTVAGVTGGTYNINVTMTNLNPGDINDIRLAHWTGGTTAGVVGTHAAATGTAPNPTAKRTGLGIGDLDAKDFRIATINAAATPLPVEFLYFDAKKNGNTVDLNWSTALEWNTSHFIVQRSQDGMHFEDVTSTKAAGNSSSVKEYYEVDYEPHKGLSYYRLRQVDNDGKYSFSDMVAVNFENELNFSIYPNPARCDEIVTITGALGNEPDQPILVVVKDARGREFYSKVAITGKNGEFTSAIDLQQRIPKGIYLVTGSSNDEFFCQKLIIH